MSRVTQKDDLGMQRTISRRDFLNGASLAVGGSIALSGKMWAEGFGLAGSLIDVPAYYPPANTGMRGSHDGSWEVAHAMSAGKRWETATPDSDWLSAFAPVLRRETNRYKSPPKR